MTAAEVLAAMREAGVELVPLDGDGILARPKAALTAELRAAIREHKERLIAIVRMREIHRAMGLAEADVLFVEQALLSGSISEIRIVVAAPKRTA
jgi:hypothetical protein